MKKIRLIIHLVWLLLVLSPFTLLVAAESGPVPGAPEESPLACAYYIAQNSSNKVLEMKKIAIMYANAKQYATSLSICSAIGDDSFKEFYILPSIIWCYGMEGNDAGALSLVESIHDSGARMISLTWLAKARLANHQDAVQPLKDAALLIFPVMESWQAADYTLDNYYDFLKRAATLANLGETYIKAGYKPEGAKILNTAVYFVRIANLDPELKFLKGEALAEIALKIYESGAKSAAAKLITEAGKYVFESKAVQVNSSVVTTLAEVYAKMRKFTQALEIAGLTRNEALNFNRFDCLEKIGMEYFRAGKKKQAIGVWRRILTEAENIETSDRIEWLGNVSEDFSRMGEAAQAKEMLQQALDIAITQKDGDLKDFYPEALLTVADKYRLIGDREKALQLTDEACVEYQLIRSQNPVESPAPDLPDPATPDWNNQLWNAITQIRADHLGAYLAMEYAQLGLFTKALQTTQSIRDPDNQVEALIFVGKLFLDNGQKMDDALRKILLQIVENSRLQKASD